MPVTDGYVYSAIEFQGSVVIAGQFSRIGDVQANNIARWNGNTWAPLGTGLQWGHVRSLTVYHGDLVAAGYFTFAGGIQANSIARWNGFEWSAFGTGFRDEMTNPTGVLAVATYRDTLIAAEELPQSGYTSPSRVAHWTGTEWVPLGSSAHGQIVSFAVKDDVLFAGGSFDSIGTVPAAGVASWDGSSWSEVGGGVGLTWGPPAVLALSVHDGQLIAGGTFDLAGGIPAQNIAAWSGTTWEPLGLGLQEGVSSLAVKQDTLFAGCGNAIARWNGQDWDFPAPPLFGTPASLLSYGDDLIVAGSIEVTNSGEDQPTAISIARLSAGRWYAFASFTERMHGLAGYGGDRAYVLSMVAYRGHIVAAGSFRFGGAPPGWIKVRDLAEWDGSRWLQFPSPPGANQIVTLLAKGDTLYAGGSFVAQGGSSPISVYRYDGSQWIALEGGSPFYIQTMALYLGNLFAAGDSPLSSEPETSIRRWNGVDWDVVGTARGSVFPLIGALVEYGGKLVAAGRFLTIDGAPATNIAAWDGTTWQQFGPGLPSPTYFSQAIVRDLAVVSGHLVVAGEAVAAGPVGSSVARWSGSTWEALGGQIGDVGRLGGVGRELFASGNLHETGDLSSYYSLARWSGYTWEKVGSGTNGGVVTFAALGNSVYMGGSLSEAGGKASYAIARWDGLRTSVGVPSFLAPRPNPFHSSTSLPYVVPVTGMVRISVHDVGGREVAVLEEGVRAVGTYAAKWSGRDRSGRKLPSGVYFIRAAMPGGIQRSRKVVLLR